MSKTILVVDDEARLVNLVKAYLEQGGFRVVTAKNGREALFVARQEKPDLIILDIMMPEMDGHEFMRVHRQERPTPIILLTAKVEEDDKIIGLELGADDYITKPFDIEELKLRVRTAINTYKRHNMTDPITGLPSSRLIEDQLRNLMRSNDWTYLQIGIDHIEPFSDEYGFLARDEVLRFTTLLLNEVDDELGTLDDFIGHATSNTFVLVTMADKLPTIIDELRQRFDEGILSHYSFIDREQGGIMQPDGQLVPLMKLSIGVVSDKTQRFSDIREITETAAELRRMDRDKQAQQ